jgi:hypothetical protein
MLSLETGATTAQNGKEPGCSDAAMPDPSPLPVTAAQDTKLASRNSTTTSEQRVLRQKGPVYGWSGSWRYTNTCLPSRRAIPRTSPKRHP